MRGTLLVLFATAALLACGCGGDAAPKAKSTKNAKKKSKPAPEVAEPPPPPAIVSKPDDFPDPAAAVAELQRAEDADQRPAATKAELWIETRLSDCVESLGKLACDAAATPRARAAACRNLGKCGPAAAAHLTTVVEQGEPEQLKVKAIEALGRIEPSTREVVDLIAAKLESSNAMMRRAALEALATIGPPAGSTEPKLLGMLKTETDGQVMKSVDKALKSVAPRKTLTPK